MLTLTRQPASLTAYARAVDLHGAALVLHLLSLGKDLSIVLLVTFHLLRGSQVVTNLLSLSVEPCTPGKHSFGDE